MNKYRKEFAIMFITSNVIAILTLSSCKNTSNEVGFYSVPVNLSTKETTTPASAPAAPTSTQEKPNPASSNVTVPSDSIKTVVIARDIGFFSIFNEFMSYLVFELEKNKKNRVYPDWHVGSIRRYNNHFVYGKKEDGNIWLKIFEPIPYSDNPVEEEAIYNKISLLYSDAHVAAINAYRHPNTFSLPQHERDLLYHEYFKKYIKPRPHIQDIIDNFIKQNFEGFTVISVHSRLPMHRIVHPESYINKINITLDDFFTKINKIIEENSIDRSNLKIFIATDNEKSINFFEAKFPNKVVYRKNVNRMPVSLQDETEKRIKNAPASERLSIAWVSEAHSEASNSSLDERSSVKNAEDVFIDAYLMSHGDYWLGGPSGLGRAVNYINPSLKKYRIDAF